MQINNEFQMFLESLFPKPAFMVTISYKIALAFKNKNERKKTRVNRTPSRKESKLYTSRIEVSLETLCPCLRTSQPETDKLPDSVGSLASRRQISEGRAWATCSADDKLDLMLARSMFRCMPATAGTRSQDIRRNPGFFNKE